MVREALCFFNRTYHSQRYWSRKIISRMIWKIPAPMVL